MLDLFSPSTEEATAHLRDYGRKDRSIDLRNLPKTKSEAVLLGIRYYYTGKACPKGHVAARYTRGGTCSFCCREKSAKRNRTVFKYTNNKALSHAARTKAALIGKNTYVPARPCPKGHLLRFTANTNCVECNRLVLRRDAQKRKEARVTRLYGLSSEQHQAMFEAQSGRCVICSQEHSDRWQMHIDHCHSAGHVRGLLCSCCNQALGLLKEDRNRFAKAVEYLDAKS